MRIRGSARLFVPEELQGRVGASVIDEEQLDLRGPIFESRPELLDESSNVLFLVVNRNDNAQRIAFHMPPLIGCPSSQRLPVFQTFKPPLKFPVRAPVAEDDEAFRPGSILARLAGQARNLPLRAICTAPVGRLLRKPPVKGGRLKVPSTASKVDSKFVGKTKLPILP